MESSEHTAEEIARRGWEIYERDIHPEVDPAHTGEFVIVDITSGDYAISASEAEAFDQAETRNPEGLFYLLRVGHRTAHRIGASFSSPRF